MMNILQSCLHCCRHDLSAVLTVSMSDAGLLSEGRHIGCPLYTSVVSRNIETVKKTLNIVKH